jgi:hypothetical protein
VTQAGHPEICSGEMRGKAWLTKNMLTRQIARNAHGGMSAMLHSCCIEKTDEENGERRKAKRLKTGEGGIM